MTDKRKVPEIRFEGFDGEWEEQHIGDVIEDYIEKTIIQNQYPILTSSQQFGVVLQEHYFANRQVTTNKNIGYFVLPKGHFTYRSRSDTDLFVFNRNDIIDNGVISYFYPVFNVKDTDSDFFLRRINHGTKQQLAMAAEGTGQRVLSHSKFKKMALFFPLIEEQSQIGTFFQNLDSLITLHQRKYDKLTTVKKAMLEKMFPKDGADVPEIRFKGFTEKWERRTLGEITEVLDGDRGKNYPNENEFQERGHTLFLSAANVTKEGFVFENCQYITEEKSNSLGNGKLNTNDILLTSRGSIGHIAWYNHEIQMQVPFARINSGMLILRSKHMVKPCFITHFLKSPFGKYQIDFISFGSAQPQLTKKDVSTYTLSFPVDHGEQSKIGSFFNNLDSLITLQQRELDKLKNIKKACLERMFV